MSLSWVVFLNEKKNCVYRITLNCLFFTSALTTTPFSSGISWTALSRKNPRRLERTPTRPISETNKDWSRFYHPLNFELENQWLHRPNWRRPWKKLLGLNWRGFEENWRILLKIFEASNRNFFASGELFFKVPEDMKWKKWFNQSELVGTALLLCWTEQSFKLPEYSQLYLWSIFFVMLHCLSCIRILYK